MINLENLTATEAEALAYAEGFPGTARLFARIDNLQRALGQAVAALEATTAGALWLNDLEDFEAGWEKMVKTRTATTGNTVRKVYVTTKKPKKAAATVAAATT